MNIKLSVAFTTYNHEKYLSQSLDSILSQKVNFNYEIVLGEDASKDRTREIAENYRKKYPGIIRAVYRDHNLGYTVNFDGILKQCRGEYIAIFDGDDIMLPGKLQRQVDFLDSHPDYVMVGHDVRVFENENGKTISIASPGVIKEFYVLEDVIKHGSFIGNCSKMFRAKCLPAEGIDHRIKYIADWYLTMKIAKFGKIGYLPEILSDYRWHAESIMRNLRGKDHFADKMLIIELINKQLNYKYEKLFNRQKAYAFLVYGINELLEHNISSARAKIFQSFKEKYNYSFSQFFYLVVAFSPKPLRTSLLRLRNQYNHPIQPVSEKPVGQKILSPSGNRKQSQSGMETKTRKITVLLFHRIHPVRDLLWDPMDPLVFENIIIYLKKNFSIIPLEPYLLGLSSAAFSKPLCAVTFDDGYKDFIHYALPVLNKHQVPASVYIITNSVNQGIPPWTYIRNHLFLNTSKLNLNINTEGFPTELQNTGWKTREERIVYAKKFNLFLKTLSEGKRIEINQQINDQFNDVPLPDGIMMNWDDIREISNHNCIIGSHSAGHPVLSKILSKDELLTELKESAEAIEKNTGLFPYSISYPFGFYNNEVIKCSKEVGYKIGLTVNPVPYNSSLHNHYEVPRIELYNEPFLKTWLRVNNIMPAIKRIFSH